MWHLPAGLTLRKPDAKLLSLGRLVGSLGGAVCTRAVGWRDLIGACARGAHHWLVHLSRPQRANRTAATEGTAMTSMTITNGSVTGGVDTHGQTHHGAVLGHIGRQLGDQEFPATPLGYRALLQWMSGYGTLDQVGVEGTGTYGAALTRHLLEAQVRVVEVDRPDRKARLPTVSPTRLMPTRLPVPRCLGRRPACRRPVMAESRLFERSGWRGRARSRPAARPSTS